MSKLLQSNKITNNNENHTKIKHSIEAIETNFTLRN